MKKLLLILVSASTFYLASGQSKFVSDRNGSVKRQKQIVNQNCIADQGTAVYAWPNHLVDEPKSVSEKNFKDYIISNYPNDFPKVTLRLCVVFQPNVSPCCRQIEIADSLSMDKKQLDYLTDLVLKYPVFKQVQFDKNERVKHLYVSMGHYKKSDLNVGFSDQ